MFLVCMVNPRAIWSILYAFLFAAGVLLYSPYPYLLRLMPILRLWLTLLLELIFWKLWKIFVVEKGMVVAVPKVFIYIHSLIH